MPHTTIFCAASVDLRDFALDAHERVGIRPAERVDEYDGAELVLVVSGLVDVDRLQCVEVELDEHELAGGHRDRPARVQVDLAVGGDLRGDRFADEALLGVHVFGAVDLVALEVFGQRGADQLHVLDVQPDLRPVAGRHVAADREQAGVVAQRQQIEVAAALEEREVPAGAEELDLRHREEDLRELVRGRIRHDHRRRAGPGAVRAAAATAAGEPRRERGGEHERDRNTPNAANTNHGVGNRLHGNILRPDGATADPV